MRTGEWEWMKGVGVVGRGKREAVGEKERGEKEGVGEVGREGVREDEGKVSKCVSK